MSDWLDRLLREVDQVERGATPGPWWRDEDDRMWRLHGVHARWTNPGMRYEQIMNHQILKAPKTGTPYAEYWPGPGDEAFIIRSRDYVPRLRNVAQAAVDYAGRLRAAGLTREADELLELMDKAAAQAPFQPLPGDDEEEGDDD